jgi:hypothetical protein
MTLIYKVDIFLKGGKPLIFIIFNYIILTFIYFTVDIVFAKGMMESVGTNF